MNISLDATLLLNDKWSGVQQYTYHIIDEMTRQGEGHIFRLHCDQSVSNPRMDGLTSRPNVVRHDRTGGRYSALLPLDLMRLRSRVYYGLRTRIRTPLPCRAAMTVYDCGWLTHPQFYEPGEAEYNAAGMRRSAGFARAIVTISESVKAQVVDLLRFDPARVFVAPPGAERAAADTPLQKPAGLPEGVPFFLTVNPGRPYKNWRDLFGAFVLYLAAHPEDRETRLVLAGDLRAEAEKVRQVLQENPSLAARTLCLGFVSDSELSYLYRRARLVVAAALFEGFGIPVLEAMACGCPVIVSDIPIFREVARDATLTFPLGKPEHLAEAMYRLNQSDDLRADLIHKGDARVDAYSWAESGRRTLETLTQMVQN